MNAICRHLAADLDVALETRVAGFEREDGSWHLSATGDRDLGRYDALVVSAPAPQSTDLLAGVAPALARAAAKVPMAPCWAVMLSFSEPLDLAFEGAFVHGSPLSWLARNSSKPARDGLETWVLHASPDWSRDNLELGSAAVTEILSEAFALAVGGLAATPTDRQTHRWRFALPTEPLPDPCLFDPDLRLAVCGDWCAGPRVEGAFLSGCAAADRLLTLDAGSEPPDSIW
jgi:predicted NAD/FAD-dependent oxidoreductase